jgi:hypothetical protein
VDSAASVASASVPIGGPTVRLKVSHSWKLDSLVSHLRRAGCQVAVAADSIRVLLPEVGSKDVGVSHIRAYVQVWQQRQARAGVQVRVVWLD